MPKTTRAETRTLTVNGSIEMADPRSVRKNPGSAKVVVWLVPMGGTNTSAPASPPARKKFTLVQKNKSFDPHVLVIPAGSEVEFPNKDPFFHNVFSLFEGKRFDLGLYESGTSRSLRFDRPGISYLFCNIHSEMSAVIIVLDTPYYATSTPAGAITIPDVPVGRYTLHMWKEGLPAGTLNRLSKTITVSPDTTSLGRLVVPDGTSTPLAHKNKYDRDYENPIPPGQIYEDR